MSGVFEHLTDDRAPALGVSSQLDLNERRAGVLIDQEVVDRPAISEACCLGDALLPGAIRAEGVNTAVK